MEINNDISLQSELNRSIEVSKSNLHNSLERLKFLVSNFNGSEEHLRALEFVESCASIEFANLKHLNKMHNKEVSSPSFLKRFFTYLGFRANAL
ncbi:hypothetical protein EBR43_03820 [bacterium]|nr:hypothetical protein [bacterium]